MSESLFPPIEHFQPDDFPIEQECAQIAFAVIEHYGGEYNQSEGAMLVRMVVSQRVDSLFPDENENHTAVRVRTAPMKSLDNLEPCQHDFCEPDACNQEELARGLGVVIVELGTAEGDDFVYDEDFDWSPKVAIVVEYTDQEGVSDVYICDANTGEVLDQQQKTELLFLLQYIEKNLLGVQLENLVESASEYSSIQPIEPVRPVFGESLFINKNACPVCEKPYGLCAHRTYPLN